MTTIIKELVEGHSYEDVLAGFEIQRVFRVGGLVDTPERQLIEASLDPGVPQLGNVYPGTTGILCVRRNVVPDGPNAARVILTYSAERNVSSYNQPEPTANEGQDVKQVSSSLREVTRTTDRGGTPMTLPAPSPKYDGLESYLSEARVLVPAGEIVFERVEKSPAVATARTIVGKLNEFTIGSYAAGTLLFVSLDAVSNDGGYLWNCTYTFRYDSAGWGHVDAWHDQSGRVPPEATPQTFDVLEHTTFAGLDLDFGDAQTPIT